MVLVGWQDIAIMTILSVAIAAAIVKIFRAIVNKVEKLIVPELDPRIDKWKFEGYLARYNSEIEFYSSRNKLSRLFSVDFVDMVNHDIEHDNGNTCFIPLLNLSRVDKVSFGKFVQRKKKLCYYHFISFAIICILLSIFDYYILNNPLSMCIAFLILGGFLIEKILFTWNKIIQYEFLLVFLEEASGF